MVETKSKLVRPVERKSMPIRESGRSSDFISPTIGHGCLLNCTYCYMKRHMHTGLNYATNIDQILEVVDNHVNELSWPKPANQTHEVYWTYDISCNEDFALHANKFYDWRRIFDFFKYHPRAMATLATKIVPEYMLEYNPEGKVRIRFSMMPQDYASILEPNTAKIKDRLEAVGYFIQAGYDVHLNFSPVIVHQQWLTLYKELFQQISNIIEFRHREGIEAEVIFLTHNKHKHEYNVLQDLPGEHLLWRPLLQEDKISSYGGNNIRYNRLVKPKAIQEFRQMINTVLPWMNIRYIF